MKSLGFKLYGLFTISWFVQLGSRVPLLGAMRIDLVLLCVLFALAAFTGGKRDVPASRTERAIRVLIAYSILSAPFVEWPGTVLRVGLESLLKAVAFFYFTVAFVDTPARLRNFVLVFTGCQLFRVLEPLYLHVTQGYWGSYAAMANWEYMDRLSGAPADVVNPNGLAFVICMVLSFLFFTAGVSWRRRVAALLFIPACLYALLLTGSRSGLVGLIALFGVVLAKSRWRLLLIVLGVAATVVVFPMLGADMQDRYLSLFGFGTKNAATAEGRLEEIKSSWSVALRRPMFGHGLGTSREANANFAGEDKPAHDLYAEVAQELGLVGLLIFLVLMRSILLGLRECRRYPDFGVHDRFLASALDASQAWFAVNLAFSVASYGLTSYEWYLLGGLAVAMRRLAGWGDARSPAADADAAEARPIGSLAVLE